MGLARRPRLACRGLGRFWRARTLSSASPSSTAAFGCSTRAPAAGRHPARAAELTSRKSGSWCRWPCWPRGSGVRWPGRSAPWRLWRWQASPSSASTSGSPSSTRRATQAPGTVMDDMLELMIFQMTTLLAAARLIGLPLAAALAIQLAGALLAAAAVWLAFRHYRFERGAHRRAGDGDLSDFALHAELRAAAADAGRGRPVPAGCRDRASIPASGWCWRRCG